MLLKRLLLIVLVAVLASPIAACGRKSDPVGPPGSDYPRQYPTK